MSIQIIEPGIHLKPYIKSYWVLNTDHCIENYTQRIIPSGFIELTFYFESFPRYNKKEENIQHSSVLSGQHSYWYNIEVCEKLNMLSILFTPQGARQFFDFPLEKTFNKSIPTDLLDKKPFNILEKQLHTAGNTKKQIMLLEQYFTKQLYRIESLNFKRLDSSIKLITQTKGVCNLDQLSNDACLSTKQYMRIFKQHVGIGPKLFNRIVRLQHAIYQRQINSLQQLTTLAYSSGYFDQAHMITDFKQLTGYTPGEYFNLCPAYSDYFS